MAEKEQFKVRYGYGSKNLLAEFLGDHRRDGFPQVDRILEKELEAKPIPHPDFSEDALLTLALRDEHISMWEYKSGRYEIHDDVWALFISAPKNNVRVMADIESALLKSGLFEKSEPTS